MTDKNKIVKHEPHEIWCKNPNSVLGWVRHSGPFTRVRKTEKRIRDLKLFDSVKGCEFSIRPINKEPLK